MNEQIAKTVSVLTSMISLLDREARELKKRNFSAVASLTREKSALVEKIEALAQHLTYGERDKTFGRHLEIVAAKARENAEQLSLLKTGLADARQRLEALAEENRLTGVYARSGNAIKSAALARTERDA